MCLSIYACRLSDCNSEGGFSFFGDRSDRQAQRKGQKRRRRERLSQYRSRKTPSPVQWLRPYSGHTGTPARSRLKILFSCRYSLPLVLFSVTLFVPGLKFTPVLLVHEKLPHPLGEKKTNCSGLSLFLRYEDAHTEMERRNFRSYSSRIAWEFSMIFSTRGPVMVPFTAELRVVLSTTSP